MENQINEQAEVNSQPAAAEIIEGENKTEASLGKFKDVQSLLSAYNSLEAEFTKRCQKLKELECALSVGDKVIPQPETVIEKDKPSEEEKNEILKEYVRSVLCKKPIAPIMDGSGVGVKSQSVRPKNLREASTLAKELFIKQKGEN